MASSSSSSNSASISSSQSCNYDIFLSFRGEDVRKNFVDHFYKALIARQISTYKDDRALTLGESIRPALFKAIKESRIAVIIFSKNYASSSWCLDELAHIMKCRDERGLTVMPIFYDVEPSEVRKQKGDFGKAFAQQESENINKARFWRKALVDASNVAGWEPKNIAGGFEAKVIERILDTILTRLFPLASHVDEELVGMRPRLRALESLLDIGSGGVRMVGIWGVGGSGKTTLATSVYMKISNQFQSHCILGNVREESRRIGLKRLQRDMLATLFKTKVKLQSVEEGKFKIKSMLYRRKVLVLLDDVDKVDQLDALAGLHNWFGDGSRIIITSRDEHILSKVDHIYPMKLLSHDEASRLFKRHAYNEKNNVVENYSTFASRVVSYAAGLPLAIKVLGSFLYDKNKKEWMSTLDRLKDIPEIEIVKILKISYDGLKCVEKELFLDIACFWRRKMKDNAMEILEAFDFHPEIGIKVLQQKSLITIVNDGFGVKFDMHDLVQEMAHYIVRGEHPKNLEKHSRVWNCKEIQEIWFEDTTKKNNKIEALTYHYDYSPSSKIVSCKHDDSSRVCQIFSNMKKLRWLSVELRDANFDGGPTFLSNRLRYMDWKHYPANPFPHSFQPMKLVVLKLWNSMQRELWNGLRVDLPCLKILQLKDMWRLVSTPDFDRLPFLQKLTLDGCNVIEEIHPSLGKNTSLEHVKVSFCRNLRKYPTISHMENLKTLRIQWCHLKDGELPSGIGELSNLQELDLRGNDFSRLDFSLSQLPQLKLLNMRNCVQLLELPKLPSSLAILNAQRCNSLTTFGSYYKNCKHLSQVSLKDVRSIMNSDKILQSTLEGVAIENGSMVLELEGVEVAKGFRPRLLRDRRCRLHLPENWRDDFFGFLMCIVIPDYLYSTTDTVCISINQVMDGSDFHQDVVWKEGSMDKYTWVGYVSFGLLRRTTWWNQGSKSLDFQIEDRYDFGVRLVEKRNRCGNAENSIDSSSRYTPTFKIKQESTSSVIISISSYDL